MRVGTSSNSISCSRRSTEKGAMDFCQKVPIFEGGGKDLLFIGDALSVRRSSHRWNGERAHK